MYVFLVLLSMTITDRRLSFGECEKDLYENGDGLKKIGIDGSCTESNNVPPLLKNRKGHTKGWISKSGLQFLMKYK